MNNQQTPLEKLISDKERIQRQCKRQEQKLNEDFSYIQENAGSLLLSGLSSLLFPSNKSTTKTNDKNTAPVTAGCAKYRYNKLELGEINGIPRVLDAGQCNDSYNDLYQ